MIRKMVPIVCIVLGVIVLIYPTAIDRYESYQQQQILKQWQDNLKDMDLGAPETETAAESIPTPLPETSTIAISQPEPLNITPTAAKPVPVHYKNMEGVLSIDKINLKLPILTNATVANLNLSIASIANTGKAGAIGNYSIAGHRNLTYGKNFNRLDEVAVGDLIEVDTGSKKYTYKVEDKKYVLPEDVWVLKGNGKDREITLITCHPMENATHRIIIKGKMVEGTN
ncbi:sortase A [Paenibacillus sp. 1_12]|uniref:class D sortase n=1 Tax=Paenibacillus sp. 1_12 TaxID=1566278 RepID=UPI0008F453CA|nr:class D sortase [Paenibacillus sp. 1_12]SFM22828.1 sortase A [Paenibacillus sp. 1_12]